MATFGLAIEMDYCDCSLAFFQSAKIAIRTLIHEVFESNLVDSGYTKSVSKDGLANIYTKGDVKYTTRDFSNSAGPTAEVSVGGQTTSKIRFGD